MTAAAEPAKRLRALGHPARLALNRALQARTNGPATPVELAAAVGISVREARRQLQVLTAVGLVMRLNSGPEARFVTVPLAARELAHSVHTPLVQEGPICGSAPAGVPSARLRLLSRVAEQVGDGVALIDPDGWVIYANPAFAVMHGHREADIAGQHYTAFYLAEGQEEVLAQLITEARQRGVGRAETWRRRRDGTLFPAAVTLSLLCDEADGLVGRVLSVRDITDRRAWEDKLREQALHDALTGLPNRRLLLDRLSQLLAFTPPQPVVVLFIDLDDFKQVNDRHGHETGDGLLVEVSRRLAGGLRPEDTVGRLGGDEFVVLLPGADLAGAYLVADRLRDAVRGPLRVGRHVLTVGLSIGMATSTAGPADGLLGAADADMYRDKVRRRGSRSYPDCAATPP